MTDTPKEAEFRALVRSLLDRGITPTPSVIAEHQGDKKYVNKASAPHRGPTLSGSLSTIRIEEFERAGWVKADEGKWYRP